MSSAAGSGRPKRVTIEEFLSNPQFEGCEYENGHVVERPLFDAVYSGVFERCFLALDRYFNFRDNCYAAPHLLCHMNRNGEIGFRVVDIGGIVNDTSSDLRFLDRAPDIALEFARPDKSIKEMFARMHDYVYCGAKVALLVLPADQTVIAFLADLDQRIAGPGDELDLSREFPGLRINNAELFG